MKYNYKHYWPSPYTEWEIMRTEQGKKDKAKRRRLAKIAKISKKKNR